MKENNEKMVVRPTSKQVYEKPSIQIYEMENEGDLMQYGSGSIESITNDGNDYEW